MRKFFYFLTFICAIWLIFSFLGSYQLRISLTSTESQTYSYINVSIAPNDDHRNLTLKFYDFTSRFENAFFFEPCSIVSETLTGITYDEFRTYCLSMEPIGSFAYVLYMIIWLLPLFIFFGIICFVSDKFMHIFI